MDAAWVLTGLTLAFGGGLGLVWMLTALGERGSISEIGSLQRQIFCGLLDLPEQHGILGDSRRKLPRITAMDEQCCSGSGGVLCCAKAQVLPYTIGESEIADSLEVLYC